MTSPILQPLADEITSTRGVIQSAIALINGIGARVQAAVDAATASGASAEQLAPFVDLTAALDADRVALADAVAANQ